MPEKTQKQARTVMRRSRRWGARTVRPGTERMIEVTSGGASIVMDAEKFTELAGFKETIEKVKVFRGGSA